MISVYTSGLFYDSVVHFHRRCTPECRDMNKSVYGPCITKGPRLYYIYVNKWPKKGRIVKNERKKAPSGL